jgi:hypothetical protein
MPSSPVVDDDAASGAPAEAGKPDAPIENEIASRASEIASDTVEHAQRLGSAARERILRTADEQKQSLAEGLEGLARNIDDVGGRAGGDLEDLQRRAAGGAARALRSVSRALSERSAEELLDEAGRQIRRRPGLFIASCVALGFLGARLLRR